MNHSNLKPSHPSSSLQPKKESAFGLKPGKLQYTEEDSPPRGGNPNYSSVLGDLPSKKIMNKTITVFNRRGESVERNHAQGR